jgi:hypothetical protein
MRLNPSLIHPTNWIRSFLIGMLLHSGGWLKVASAQISATNQTVKRIALQMGGNCEKDFNRTGENNIFLSGMSKERKMLENGKWEVRSLYNGNTEPFEFKVKSNKPTGSISPSTRENFFKQLDNLIESTSLGNRNDQQVLISMKSHGNKGGICISESETLSYDDPEFQKRLAKIQQQSKIGIIVDSCYSGSAIPALTQYGCVITSQTGSAFSTGDPSSDAVKTLFLNAMGKDQPSSMEDLFLQMQATTKQTFPQMSGFNEGDQLAQAYLKQFSNLDEADWWQLDLKKNNQQSQCDSTTPLKSFRNWINMSKSLFDQQRLNDYYPNQSAQIHDLKSISKKIEQAHKRTLEHEAISKKYDQTIQAILNLKKPSEIENPTHQNNPNLILFDQLSRLKEKLDQIENSGPQYIGVKSNIPGTLITTDDFKKQSQEIKALNHFLSARYLQSLTEPTLTREEKQARKNCQEFNLFDPLSDQ